MSVPWMLAIAFCSGAVVGVAGLALAVYRYATQTIAMVDGTRPMPERYRETR